MPTLPTRVEPLKSWSWSRYAVYCECPLKFKLKFLLKREEPGGPAMARGKSIHDMADAFVRDKLSALPAELKNFAAEFRMLKKVKAKTEADARIGLDRGWSPVDYFDWARCWLRVVIDAKYVKKVGRTTRRLVVIDHKTGRVYGDNAEQLELSAVASLCAEPDVDEVEVQNWYLDQGLQLPEKPLVYSRDEQGSLVEAWTKKVYPMFSDKRHAAKPGDYCRRCHFRKANGGPCRF